MSAHVLVVEAVSKAFLGKVVLAEVSFSVEQSSVCALTGDNGSGKTTLLNLCAGFLTPDTGRVRVCGVPVGVSTHPGVLPITFVPDHIGLYGRFSAIENIQFFESVRGVSRGRHECVEFLDRLRFPREAVDRPVATYSKGMKQKVALAVGMLRNASLFILDEPTTGLDRRSVEELLVILREVASTGVAVLFSTHSGDHVQRLAHTVAVVQDGRVVVNNIERE